MKTNMVNLLPGNSLDISVDRLFGRLAEDFLLDGNLHPEVEYTEMEDKYQLRVAVPGLSKKDLRLSLENNVLYLSGENRQTQKQANANATQHHHFERSFVLPGDVDQSRIKARCRHGLLTVTLYKQKKANKVKYITLQGEGKNRLPLMRNLTETKKMLQRFTGGSK